MSRSKKMPREAKLGRARAAGMAAATRGKARVFEDKTEVDDSDEQIEDALADRNDQNKPSPEQLAADYSDLY